MRRLHAAGHGSGKPQLSWVFTIDCEKTHEAISEAGDAEVSFVPVLESPAGRSRPPTIKLGPMHPRNTSTEGALKKIANSRKMQNLLLIEPGHKRGVNKGRDIDGSAAVELFLHESRLEGCSHFTDVIEAMKKFLYALGFSKFVIRYHVNWTDESTQFAFEHYWHADSWKKKLRADELLTGRAVGVVNVPYTRQEFDVFRMQVQEMRNDIPYKTECEDFNVQEELGTLLYPWALHISSATQGALTRGKRREYDKLLLIEDGIVQADDDSLS